METNEKTGSRAIYMAVRCPCGDGACTSWHVAPIAQVQGVSFTEAQAIAVARCLNGMAVATRKIKVWS